MALCIRDMAYTSRLSLSLTQLLYDYFTKYIFSNPANLLSGKISACEVEKRRTKAMKSFSDELCLDSNVVHLLKKGRSAIIGGPLNGFFTDFFGSAISAKNYNKIVA